MVNENIERAFDENNHDDCVEYNAAAKSVNIISTKNIDYIQLILNDIGGTFKRYQIINYILFCIPFALSGTFGLSYVFTALNLDYRYVDMHLFSLFFLSYIFHLFKITRL